MNISAKKYILKSVCVGSLETNCYIIADKISLQSFIIDPGAEPEKIIEQIKINNFAPAGIINTHGHADHILANKKIKDTYKIPIYINKNDAPFLSDARLNGSVLIGEALISPPADIFLEDSMILNLGSLEFEVIHTPGHTPGCVCLLVEDLLFTGDTLFCGDVGRCDLPGGNEKHLFASLKKFKSLPAGAKIFPGHGKPCVLGNEFKHNTYLLSIP